MELNGVVGEIEDLHWLSALLGSLVAILWLSLLLNKLSNPWERNLKKQSYHQTQEQEDEFLHQTKNVSSDMKVPDDELVEEMVAEFQAKAVSQSLATQCHEYGIKMVVFDFDKTLIKMSTSEIVGPGFNFLPNVPYSRWSDNLRELCLKSDESLALDDSEGEEENENENEIDDEETEDLSLRLEEMDEDLLRHTPSREDFYDPDFLCELFTTLHQAGIKLGIASCAHRIIIKDCLEQLLGEEQTIFTDKNVITPSSLSSSQPDMTKMNNKNPLLQILLDQNHLKAVEVLFFDDHTQPIMHACNAGFQTKQVSDGLTLRSWNDLFDTFELAKHGITSIQQDPCLQVPVPTVAM